MPEIIRIKKETEDKIEIIKKKIQKDIGLDLQIKNSDIIEVAINELLQKKNLKINSNSKKTSQTMGA